jgi:hypothetical protein
VRSLASGAIAKCLKVAPVEQMSTQRGRATEVVSDDVGPVEPPVVEQLTEEQVLNAGEISCPSRFSERP